MTTAILIVITLIFLLSILGGLIKIDEQLADLRNTLRTMDERETRDQHILEQMILENRRMICGQEDDGK